MFDLKMLHICTYVHAIWKGSVQKLSAEEMSWRSGPHFVELVINDNLPFNDNYHGNSAS